LAGRQGGVASGVLGPVRRDDPAYPSGGERGHTDAKQAFGEVVGDGRGAESRQPGLHGTLAATSA
jgi:hypothetical protein